MTTKNTNYLPGGEMLITGESGVGEARIGQPRVRDARGSETLMVAAPDAGGSPMFRGLEGALAVGHFRTDSGDATELRFSIESTIPLQNIQLIQPLHLGLDAASYVIAPGAMYDGNRMQVSKQTTYCPAAPTEGVSADGPLIQTDIPRLTPDTNFRADFAANAFCMPVVGIFDPGQQAGFLVGIEVYGVWGVTGVNLITVPGEPVTVEICLPVKRERRYRFLDWIKVDEAGMDLVPGQTVSGRVRIIRVRASSIAGFVTRVAEYGYENRGRVPRPPSLSFPQSAALIEAKYNVFNWHEKNGYYGGMISILDYSGVSSGFLSSGWCFGGVVIVSMIGSDNPVSRQRALRMLDVFCRDALSPSGYFYGAHDGTKWYSVGGYHGPNNRHYSLVRHPMECARDVLKCLTLLRDQGVPLQPHWEAAARSNLDAACGTVERFGHLGYHIDFETGDVLWGDSTCGAFGIEPLVRGAAWFKEARYLETAETLAAYYCKHFLARGLTCGGPGDALTAADSESSYALLAGLVHLHAATGKPQHLGWARQAADLFCTWVLSYDAILPEGKPLARLGIAARGAVFANTQNQHGAPGICTASGEALLRLYQVTGEERYLRTLEDIAQCIPQMIVQPGQQEIWRKSPPGCISERLMTMDGMKPNGETEPGSTWPETSMLLTVRELPAHFHDPERNIDADFEMPPSPHREWKTFNYPYCSAKLHPPLEADWTVFGPIPAPQSNVTPAPESWTSAPAAITVADVRFDGRRMRSDGGVLHVPDRSGPTLLAATVWDSEADGTLQIAFSADWWARWWINGQPAYSTFDKGNEVSPGTLPRFAHIFGAPVRRGPNLIVVQIAGGRDSCAVAMEAALLPPRQVDATRNE